MTPDSSLPSSRSVALLVAVAALGYFVDIYDLILFTIVRIESFKDIGIPESSMRQYGQYVLNMQMGGLLIGGILWGVIGDKFGRIKVLFGSILMYSLANIANGFVQDVHTYAIIRFIAGIGLAGELGAGITLISETMSKEKRGYGTMIVAGVGVLGAIAAAWVAKEFDWRTAYFVGGAMGLILLLLRVGTFESGMYKSLQEKTAARANIFTILTSKQRVVKYLYCILIGVPIWFVIGILVALSPEFGKVLGAPTALSAGTGIMYTYLGVSIGDILAGLLAQVTKSRKMTVLIFQLFTVISASIYLSSTGITQDRFIVLAFCMGFGVGYWATFVTIASEQFGTNVRATVTTTAPNFVRGALIPITFVFEGFVRYFGLITSAYITLFFLTGIAMFALSRLEESFNKDLNYIEELGT